MRALVLILLLTGCNANGPLYNAPNKPSVIIYRENNFYMSTRRIPVDIDGKSVCDLHNGSYFVYYPTSDKINISASIWDLPGTTRKSYSIDPSEMNYVRLSFDGGTSVATMLGGIAGTALAENNGPFSLTIMPENQAAHDLAGLHQDCI